MRVAARGRRYTVKPTQCVRGCGRTLVPLNYRRKQYVCFTCSNADRGHVPMYAGPCLRECGRKGRGRSALCAACYFVVSRRRRRQHALLAAVLGEVIPLESLIQFIREPRMQTYTVKLLAALFDGRLTLVDGQAFAHAARRRWATA